LLAWPYPGREHLPRHVLGELERYDALPEDDTPIDAAYLLDGGAVVLAGDERSGQVLAIVDEHADHGTAAYTGLIAALREAGMHVFAGNDAGRDYSAGWEYHPPAGNGRESERRRRDRGVLVVSACDLLEDGERTVAEVADEILAARTRRLISYPAGLPAAVLAAAY
jgi:hypothetical protein